MTYCVPSTILLLIVGVEVKVWSRTAILYTIFSFSFLLFSFKGKQKALIRFQIIPTYIRNLFSYTFSVQITRSLKATVHFEHTSCVIVEVIPVRLLLFSRIFSILLKQVAIVKSLEIIIVIN